MSYDYEEEHEHQTISRDEYEQNVFEPLREKLYEALLDWHGQMFEECYVGYPGSSQSLNIDNPFDRISEQLAQYAIGLFEEEEQGLIVDIER